MANRGGFGQVGATVVFPVGGFRVVGVAVLVLSLLIYIPYRIGSSRRARSAREAALASGAGRTIADKAAQAAAEGDSVPSRPVATGDAVEGWSLAMEQTELEEET